MGKKETTLVTNEDARYHAERLRRIQEVVAMMHKMYLPSQIKKAIAKQYGISPRTVEDYMTEAREIIRADAMGDLTVLRGQHIAWQFEKVRKSPDERIQLQAMHAIARVMGLYHADRTADPSDLPPLPPDEADPIQELGNLLDDIIPEPPE